MTIRPTAYDRVIRNSQTGFFQFPGIRDVGGKIEVERRAILNLRKEIAGGSERQLHVIAGRFFVLSHNFFEGEIQI
jgi:hypothetical protein